MCGRLRVSDLFLDPRAIFVSAIWMYVFVPLHILARLPFDQFTNVLALNSLHVFHPSLRNCNILSVIKHGMTQFDVVFLCGSIVCPGNEEGYYTF